MFPSAVKLGAWFTWVTVTVNVAGVLPVSSSLYAVAVMVAVPYAFCAGVKVSTPVAETSGCTEKRALLLFVTTNVTGPPVMFVAHVLL